MSSDLGIKWINSKVCRRIWFSFVVLLVTSCICGAQDFHSACLASLWGRSSVVLVVFITGIEFVNVSKWWLYAAFESLYRNSAKRVLLKCLIYIYFLIISVTFCVKSRRFLFIDVSINCAECSYALYSFNECFPHLNGISLKYFQCIYRKEYQVYWT